VGGLLEPQLRREATTVAVTEAAAAEMRRRARAECRKQTLIWQPGLAKRSCQPVCKCGSGTCTRAMFDRYNIIDEHDLARGVAQRFTNGQVTAKLAGAAAPAEPLS